MSDFPIGAKVRVKRPKDYIKEFERKFTNRVGEVVSFSSNERAIVLFAKEGRRKELRHSFNDRDLELSV